MNGEAANKAAPSTRSQFSIGRAWFMTSFTTFALGAVVFIVAPLSARALGTTGRGRLVTIQLAPQLLADLAAVGLGFAIIHFGSKRIGSIRTLLRWSVRPLIVGSIVMIAIGQLLAGWLTDAGLGDERRFRLYLVICPIVAFLTVLLESLRAMGDFRRWNILSFARGLTWPIALLVGAVLPATPSFDLIFSTHIVLLCVVLAAIGFSVRSKLQTVAPQSASPEPLTERPAYLRYGLSSAVSAIPRNANAKIDQILLTALITTSELGIYAAAVGWSFLPVPVLRGLTSVSMPHVSGATDEERTGRIAALVTYGLGAAAVLSAAGALVTFVLWEPIYGSDFAAGRTAAVILIPAALLLELNAVLGNVLRSLGRPGLLTIIEAGLLVIAVALLWPAASLDPILGPAMLSVLVYFGAGFVLARSIGKQIHVPAHELVKPSMLLQRPGSTPS